MCLSRQGETCGHHLHLEEMVFVYHLVRHGSLCVCILAAIKGELLDAPVSLTMLLCFNKLNQTEFSWYQSSSTQILTTTTNLITAMTH